jgi:hypothetical protein
MIQLEVIDVDEEEPAHKQAKTEHFLTTPKGEGGSAPSPGIGIKLPYCVFHRGTYTPATTDANAAVVQLWLPAARASGQK